MVVLNASFCRESAHSEIGVFDIINEFNLLENNWFSLEIIVSQFSNKLNPQPTNSSQFEMNIEVKKPFKSYFDAKLLAKHQMPIISFPLKN